MATSQERNQLKRAYPSKSWAAKVDKMDDGQVMAVFLRLKNQGKIK